ncbi:MAG: tRNA (cytidine(34)-2'-O)-methyltransferase, partial [Clostridia bacterium]|nr:tRNA (cytidine(34)-2'-O)-methyltransferase [Clostridia bacterium]
MHIVLVEPEIPQNTGNIARTCAATGCELHLVEPLGYKLEDKYLKRAGLDYWPLVKVHVHKDFAEVLSLYPDAPFYYASTKAPRSYAQVEYPEDVFLVFGKESRGLP